MEHPQPGRIPPPGRGPPSGRMPPPGRGPGTGVRAALRSPSFATLLAGYACSAIGDGMAAVAISWLAIELSRGRDTGLLVGAAVAAYTVPGVVAGFGLGRVLTRWDPASPPRSSDLAWPAW